MKNLIKHLSLRVTADDWNRIRNLCSRECRSIAGEAAFLLVQAASSLDPLPARKKEERNKKSRKQEDDDTEDFPEEREEDVKPLYGGGFPPDVEEELAESRRASLRKGKK